MEKNLDLQQKVEKLMQLLSLDKEQLDLLWKAAFLQPQYTVLTVEEVAEHLKCEKQKVYDLMDAGKIKNFTHSENSRKLLTTLEYLYEYINTCKEPRPKIKA